MQPFALQMLQLQLTTSRSPWSNAGCVNLKRNRLQWQLPVYSLSATVADVWDIVLKVVKVVNLSHWVSVRDERPLLEIYILVRASHTPQGSES